MLTVRNDIPSGLLERDATRLHEILAGPTLIHLPGRRAQPLFVSVLLHGNESTGWEAVRALLARYRAAELPRALSILVGNVHAARVERRRLDDQPDYNRIWKGAAGHAEDAMVSRVVDEMRARGVFASVDIHNNTGLNPHYACVNRLDEPFLHLATLFSRTVVYFITPDSVQSMRFAELAPSVTVECGQPGQPHGTEHAAEFVDACLHLAEFPDHPVPRSDIDLFHTVAVVRVPEACSFGFGQAEQQTAGLDLSFISDLDHLNFRELPAGTLLGQVRPGARACLEVSDEHGRRVEQRYFALRDGCLVTATAVMPSMLTLDERVIRQDCLCYLMERYGEHLDQARAADAMPACPPDP